jgi:hypothetical protein
MLKVVRASLAALETNILKQKMLLTRRRVGTHERKPRF